MSWSRRDAWFALGAQVLPPVLATLVTPVLVTELGLRAYGIVALATTASLILGAFEIGVSTAVGRAFALSGEGGSRGPVSMIHRLERRYLLAALGILSVGSAMALAFPDAVNGGAGVVHGARTSIFLLVLLVALRWPSPLYLAVLRSRRRHVTAAGLTGALATVRYASAGMVAVATQDLRCVACSMSVTAAIELYLLRRSALAGLVPDESHDALDRRFALGVTVASILAVLLKQADKVIVAAATTLALTGLYIFAANVVASAALVAAGVYGLTAPLAAGAIAARDDDRLGSIAVASAHLTLSLVAPFLLGVAVNARWILDFAFPASVAREGVVALVVLAVAGLVNSVTQVPLAIQHAAGISRYGIASNLIGVVLCVPPTALLAAKWGISGAAWGWLGFNIVYAAIVPYRSLSHISGRWLFRRWAVEGVAWPIGVTVLLFLPAFVAAAADAGPRTRFIATLLAASCAVFVNWRRRGHAAGVSGALAPLDPGPVL